MRAYVPLKPGWYVVDLDHINNDFGRLLNENTDLPIPMDDELFYDCVLRVYYTSVGVMNVETYYRGRIEEKECYGFGKQVRICHNVELDVASWDDAPDWANFLVVNPSDEALWFEKQPYASWAMRQWLDDTFRIRGKVEHANFCTIPSGVDWKELIEERPR